MVTYEPSPIMSVDHQPWNPEPVLHPSLAGVYSTFVIVVLHDSPAALALLYALATNQIPAITSPSTPTGDPYRDAVLHKQPFLVTRF